MMKILSARIPSGINGQTLASGITKIASKADKSYFAAPSLIPNSIKKHTSKWYDHYIEFLAKGIGKLAQIKPVKSLIETCVNKEINYTSHLAAFVANILNGFYMYNVHKSKKIEEEQKKPLMLNMFIGTLMATIGGYALDNIIKGKLKPFEKAMEDHYGKGTPLLKGFGIARSLMVFQFLYRFVTPVIATPIANHISNKIRDKKEGEKGLLLK